MFVDSLIIGMRAYLETIIIFAPIRHGRLGSEADKRFESRVSAVASPRQAAYVLSKSEGTLRESQNTTYETNHMLNGLIESERELRQSHLEPDSYTQTLIDLQMAQTLINARQYEKASRYLRRAKMRLDIQKTPSQKLRAKLYYA